MGVLEPRPMDMERLLRVLILCNVDAFAERVTFYSSRAHARSDRSTSRGCYRRILGSQVFEAFQVLDHRMSCAVLEPRRVAVHLVNMACSHTGTDVRTSAE
jgi:hypothetical protein